MKKIIFDMLIDKNHKIDSIINRSTPAVCGIMEREIVVNASEVSKIKTKLRKAGYVIVGTGSAGFSKKKIWFNPSGVNL